MEKPEMPKLKIMTSRNCGSTLNLYKSFLKKEIMQKEKIIYKKLNNKEKIIALQK